MVIDNEEEIVNLRKSRNLIIGLLFSFVAISFIGIIPVPWYYPFAFAILLMLLFLLYWNKQELTYIRYTDDDNHIEFKYYHIVMVSPKRKMIRIKQNLLGKYEIEKINKKEFLYVFQKTKTGLFKYPGINISSFNEEDRKKLKINLSKYASQNK